MNDQLTDTARRHLGSGRAGIVLGAFRLIFLGGAILLRSVGSGSSALTPIAVIIGATFLIDVMLVIRNRRILRRVATAQATGQPIAIPAQLPFWVAIAYNPALGDEHPRLRTNGGTALGTLSISGNTYSFVPTKNAQRMGAESLSWSVDPASALYVRASFTKYQGVLHFTDPAHQGQVVELYTRCFNPRWLKKEPVPATSTMSQPS